MNFMQSRSSTLRNAFQSVIEKFGAIPLGWAGSTEKMDYLNYGDALSPVMVALCSGQHVERVPSRSYTPRLAAVGTIGHGFRHGTTWFWGTGSSGWANPSAPDKERIPYTPPPESQFELCATRGPISNALLSGGNPAPIPYGDPVWLLPRFYRPNIEKKYELGVILHLSELSDRGLIANPREIYARYRIPESLQGSIHLINTVTEVSTDALRDKTDEILSCRRIVSTSLHGMVLAESYGIPCLYFPPHGPKPGLTTVAPVAESKIDLRIADLYSGLGVKSLPMYVQDRRRETNWEDLIAAIDTAWTPIQADEDGLLNGAPFDVAPITAKPGQDVFQSPLLQGLQLRHTVPDLIAADARRSPPPKREKSSPLANPALASSPLPPFEDIVANLGAIPLAWAATTKTNPWANLGDALSALTISIIADTPILRRNFDSREDRLVGVGTIGQAQRNGTVRFWGTGIDATRNAFDPAKASFALPPDTRFHAYGLRGPRSAATLRTQGIAVPAIYGDPVWYLPRFTPTPTPEKQWELGVILHITELDQTTPDGLPRAALTRYGIPPDLHGQIKIINTFTPNSTQGLFDKIDEIRACKCIASTSFHGLVIAEAFQIPCIWFGTNPVGPKRVSLMNPETPIDHRVHDWYSGTTHDHLPIYGQDRTTPCDWKALMAWIDSTYEPVRLDEAALFDAFPLPKAVSLSEPKWQFDAARINGMTY